MDAEEAIKLARDTIGAGEPDLYTISLTRHAAEFKEKAPDLAAILSSSEVITTAEQYEREDRKALAAQKEFQQVFNRSNLLVLATGIFAALFMATAAAAREPADQTEKALLLILSLAGVVCGGLATRDILTIKQGGFLEDWMSKRASAETTRIDYFNTVAKSPARQTAGSRCPIKLLQLEYFRRFQFDVQLAFYCEREKDHRKEARRTLTYSSWAACGAAVATGAAGVLAAMVSSSLAAVGALAVIFTGLSSFASMREAVNQNRRNAERYERTCRVLEDLKKRLDDVRSAVYAGSDQALANFVDAVHEQLSLEHRQWLGEQNEARGHFAELEKTLKDLSARLPQKSGGTDKT